MDWVEEGVVVYVAEARWSQAVLCGHHRLEEVTSTREESAPNEVTPTTLANHSLLLAETGKPAPN